MNYGFHISQFNHANLSLAEHFKQNYCLVLRHDVNKRY